MLTAYCDTMEMHCHPLQVLFEQERNVCLIIKVILFTLACIILVYSCIIFRNTFS